MSQLRYNTIVRAISCTTRVSFSYSERRDFIILSSAKRARSLLTARGLSQLRNSRLYK